MKRAFRILCLEKGVAQRCLIRAAVKAAGPEHEVEFATDFSSALFEILRVVERQRAAPDLVLIDQSLPERYSEDLLQVMRADHGFDDTLVVVWMTDIDKENVDRWMQLGGNGALKKPRDLDGCFEVISGLLQAVSRRQRTRP